MNNKKYYGKLILFGEYSMIYNSEALLMPFYAATAEWNSIITKPSENGINSNKDLFRFLNYLLNNYQFRILDLRRFEMELNAGLYFDSKIPTAYGVGSSGALVAAIYDRYKLIEIEDHNKLRTFLAEMESFFHGSSSGIDPLQCYIGKPFIINQEIQNEEKQLVLNILDRDFIPSDIKIFLIDTKIKSQTGPLVNHFIELRKNNDYLELFENEYIPTVHDCIYSLTNGEKSKFFTSLSNLSDMQLSMLEHTIPANVREFFNARIGKEHFQIKLCGAGGGGFLLGFSDNIELTNIFWEEKNYKIIWI